GKIEGRDLAVPMLDINTVSAGGGTIAEVDRFGQLQVGPHSAGAQPGPAAYGRGGDMPTITDCNLVLGYLGEDNFLGGSVPLDAGVFSAVGLVVADVRHDYMRSKLTLLAETSPADMNEMFEQLTAQATAQLRRDGFAPPTIRLEPALDMRYAGQGYEM